MPDLWTVTRAAFEPAALHNHETIFTIGNGYLATRGAFEEGYPGDRRATFVHGVFDAAPTVVTELVNMPDWLPLDVFLNGERFSLERGAIEAFEQELDLRAGLLVRRIRWRSPAGDEATLVFERFASLAEPHRLLQRVRVRPEFDGELEFRGSLEGSTANDHDGHRITHLDWAEQGTRDGVVWLVNRTRTSQIGIAAALRFELTQGTSLGETTWDATNRPTQVIRVRAEHGVEAVAEKSVALVTTRDVPAETLLPTAIDEVQRIDGWHAAFEANTAAWRVEWDRTDVIIEGDAEAQLAVRFNLFQLLIAAPRHDDRVNLGAKTLSGFGYRGHAFWDTETFMLPLFTFTAPEVARNLLTARWRELPGARRRALADGFEGARFPWESAGTGEEVTPTWVPDPADHARVIRIWAGDLELHISADVAYAVHQYWQATGDDAWFIDKGAELILDTARFWASRAEWLPDRGGGAFGYRDVVGPDEYHEHVDNNHYTNRLARWNLRAALDTHAWLRAHAPDRAAELAEQLDLSEGRLARWREVAERMYLPVTPDRLIEQFDGYFGLRDVDFADLEPRSRSIQDVFGVDGVNFVQAIKQPDVLMALYLLRAEVTAEELKANYEYYAPRTDVTYGSSLGPSIMAVMAGLTGLPDEAYQHFMRSALTDLADARGNADDGIHGASAGGTWQAVVFGFGGLRVTADGWEARPQLPAHWTRLAFRFFHRGELHTVDVTAGPGDADRSQARAEPAGEPTT
jgi:trehalose/maltose hydrolase-like predicted phosphorylase